MNKKILSVFTNLIFPNRCPCCNEIIPSHVLICEDCRHELKFVEDARCLKCGQKHENCECKRKTVFYDGFVSPFYNEGSAKNSVYGFKISEQMHSADFIAQNICNCFLKYFSDVKINIVCPVPPSVKDRKESRNFDHTNCLAKSIAGKMKLKYCRKVLKGVKKIQSQHTLGAVERVKNVRGAYAVACDVKDKNILLIDDIKTTGSTLNECTKQLLLAGANKVYCATFVMSKNKPCKTNRSTI